MINNIKYLGHTFVPARFCEDNYSEFVCEICGLSAAIKHLSYDWYHETWKILDLSCGEIQIKKLLE